VVTNDQHVSLRDIYLKKNEKKKTRALFFYYNAVFTDDQYVSPQPYWNVPFAYLYSLGMSQSNI
jgi:hypothetical protein